MNDPHISADFETISNAVSHECSNKDMSLLWIQAAPFASVEEYIPFEEQQSPKTR